MSIGDFNSNDRVTLWAIIEHSPRSVADRLVSCLRHVVDICVSLSKARHCGRCLLYGDTWHRFSCSHIVHSRLAGPTHSERVISQSELTGKLNDTVQTWTGLTHWHLGYVEVIFQCICKPFSRVDTSTIPLGYLSTLVQVMVWCNIIAADALLPWCARASAAMELT